ncbi:glycosyltransferase [Flavobacterium sp.]|uniref:glycosyltransferase n=1 Tax=Flavobacterium sp. TaxID=239 RepID=UPI0028BEFBE0|nr:glycosyltransferase [Flavobacterium sp.]
MIKQDKVIKVALVGDCLANGGAEKVHALLSNYFYKEGLEVHNCIFMDWVTYEYSGSLCNLGTIASNSNSVYRKIKRFLAFKTFVNSNSFDIIIDFRIRNIFLKELMFVRIIYPKNIIYTVHSGFLEFYFPRTAFLSRLIYNNKKIVSVSKAIQDEILKNELANKVQYLHNPLDFESIEVFKMEKNKEYGLYVLAVGRMNNDIKQFDRLIEAYFKSDLPNKKIKLVLLGDGENRSKYEELSFTLGLSELVVFEGVVSNPFPYYKSALFTVLASKNEGFPNTIIESLAVNTPVVSFDCFSGPNEIIKDKTNGLLVENQNFEKLISSMNLFINDQQLYQNCKKNSRESVSQYDIEIIGKQWLDLFNKA